MARVNPEQFQEKHARRLKASTEDIRRGVENVTESPTAKAAQKAQKMKQNLVAAVDSGKWAAGLNRVTTEEWKQKTIDKGIPRIAAGIDAAAPKVVAFAQQLLPHVDAGKAKIAKLPDVTLEDNINRMVEYTRHMANFKRK